MLDLEIKTFGANSSGVCLLVTLPDGKKIVLDAGVKASLPLDAPIFITHEHEDHAKFVKHYLFMSMDVYTTQGTIDALGIKHHRLHTLNGDTVGGMLVETIPLIHDAKQPVALVFTGGGYKLAYITDAGEIPAIPTGTTHLIVECNHTEEGLDQSFLNGDLPEVVYKRIKKNHLSLETLERFFKENELPNLQELYLTHLSAKRILEEKAQKRLEAIVGLPVKTL